MYYLGIILALGAVIALAIVESGRDFILTVYDLSPEITVMILIGYFYPLFLFAYTFFVTKEGVTRKFFHTQVTVASTLCVSLGLIGTFLGLSSMVAAISSGMNADGDFGTKITMLLSSIGLSLDSMSLAFLTSILGVGASTVLAVACNYLAFFYDDNEAPLVEKSVIHEGDVFEASGLDPSASTTMAENISNSLNVKVFELLGDTIKENNLLQRKLVASFGRFEATQSKLLQEMEGVQGGGGDLKTMEVFNRLGESFEANIDEFGKAVGSMASFSGRMMGDIGTISSSLSELHSSFKTFEYKYQEGALHFNKLVDGNTKVISELTSVVNDIKYVLAPPIHVALEQAIYNDELDLVYLPHVDKTGALLGCEVLLQWNDRVRGAVPNVKIFNSEMEKYPELMLSLDKWILENTIKKLSDWARKGLWNKDWIISVNIGKYFLQGSSLLNHFRDLLEEYVINPSNIALEFKDADVLSDVAEIKYLFRGIRDLGGKVYVDNYGKSNSSLTVYQQMKVDKVKIDRSVINGLLDEAGDDSVVRSIMASAAELGLDLIVEGVENRVQRDRLVELGFLQFQGHIFSRPVIDIRGLLKLATYKG